MDFELLLKLAGSVPVRYRKPSETARREHYVNSLINLNLIDSHDDRLGYYLPTLIQCSGGVIKIIPELSVKQSQVPDWRN